MSDNYAASILCYGATGTRKTTNVGSFAKYIWEQTGAPVRLVSADGGGWEPIEPYIRAGIVDPYRLVDTPLLLENVRLLMKGCWPDKDGKLVKNSDKVGAYAIEGLTSIALLMLRHLVNRGQKIGQDIVGQFREGAETFGNAAMTHYGFVQSQTLDIIGAGGFSSIPVLSNRILYTAHEAKGQDDIAKTTVYGPASVGKAITDKIPLFVGDLLHFETTVLDTKKNESTVRAYFRNHADSDLQSVQWPAKVRMPFDVVADFQARWPQGFIDLGSETLYDYLKFMDEVRLKSANSVQAWKEQLNAKV